VYFFKTPRLLHYLYPGAIWHGDRNKKQIYLTFDDGPVPMVTDYILDVLGEHDVKATFFCVGENVGRHPGAFRRIIREGHGIGNHTFNHLDGWKVSEKDYLENVQRCSRIIRQQGYPEDLLLFRPPYGKIRRGTLRKLTDNYRVIMWDVLSYDFSNKVSPEKGLGKSIQHTQNGTIIIFHDSMKTLGKIKFMISQYILAMKENNYEFCTLTDMFSSNFQ
jgi:peptidoglycan/xylan/chitin deacetylase (PgdA/CDA1 family)